MKRYNVNLQNWQRFNMLVSLSVVPLPICSILVPRHMVREDYWSCGNSAWPESQICCCSSFMWLLACTYQPQVVASEQIATSIPIQESKTWRPRSVHQRGSVDSDERLWNLIRADLIILFPFSHTMDLPDTYSDKFQDPCTIVKPQIIAGGRLPRGVYCWGAPERDNVCHRRSLMWSHPKFVVIWSMVQGETPIIANDTQEIRVDVFQRLQDLKIEVRILKCSPKHAVYSSIQSWSLKEAEWERALLSYGRIRILGAVLPTCFSIRCGTKKLIARRDQGIDF